MQTWSGQNTGGASSPTRKLVATVLIVFSLAGLVIGFAVGGLTRPQPTTSTTTNPPPKQTVVTQVTSTPTATPTPPPVVVLGLPQFVQYPTATESISGGTTYTVNMQAVDKQKKPVNSADVVCKLWLVQQIPDKQKLDIDKDALKVDNLSNPIQGTVNNHPVPEMVNYLSFDATTPQLTHCGADGKASWKYQLSPTAQPGDYSLVILADWKGVHYNWSWANIAITA